MEKLLPSSRQENVRLCKIKSDRVARRNRKTQCLSRLGLPMGTDCCPSAPSVSVFLGASLCVIKDFGVTLCESSNLGGRPLPLPTVKTFPY